jgi:hypothetical protein
MGYGLDDRHSISGRGKTGSRAHSASYPMGRGTDSQRVKWAGSEADQAPPTSADVKNTGAISSLPYTSSWRGAYLIKHNIKTAIL